MILDTIPFLSNKGSNSKEEPQRPWYQALCLESLPLSDLAKNVALFTPSIYQSFHTSKKAISLATTRGANSGLQGRNAKLKWFSKGRNIFKKMLLENMISICCSIVEFSKVIKVTKVKYANLSLGLHLGQPFFAEFPAIKTTSPLPSRPKPT